LLRKSRLVYGEIDLRHSKEQGEKIDEIILNYSYLAEPDMQDKLVILLGNYKYDGKINPTENTDKLFSEITKNYLCLQKEYLDLKGVK